MKVTIDRAGRLVFPKPLREALGLRGGEELEISARGDGRLELEVPTTPMRLVRRGARTVAVADGEMPVLTQSAVRETLERIRH